MTENERITLLLVDDHAVVRQGVRTYLSMQPDLEVLGEADSGKKAIELATELLPDVVLMDLIMPGEIDGVEATRRIKQISPRTQIIVLTSYHEDEHIFPAIQAGALSYILKDVDAADLVTAVRKAARGEATISPHVATRLMQELHAVGIDKTNPYTLLSEREVEVLQHIANGKANAEIAETLHITIKTVRAHVSNMLSKLHLKDRTQAAVYAWREGIVRKN